MRIIKEYTQYLTNLYKNRQHNDNRDSLNEILKETGFLVLQYSDIESLDLIGLPNLSSLTLYGGSGLTDLAPLKAITGLSSLNLYGISLLPEG